MKTRIILVAVCLMFVILGQHDVLARNTLGLSQTEACHVVDCGSWWDALVQIFSRMW